MGVFLLTCVAVALTGWRREFGTPKVTWFASTQQTVKIFFLEALVSHLELNYKKKHQNDRKNCIEGQVKSQEFPGTWSNSN